MALRYISTQETWQGERINGVAHPKSIEFNWTSGELAGIGLEVFTVDPVDPAPASSTAGTFEQFMDLFTPTERDDLHTETLADIAIKDWYDLIKGNGTAVMDSQSMSDGLDLCVAAGVLTQVRADALKAQVWT